MIVGFTTSVLIHNVQTNIKNAFVSIPIQSYGNIIIHLPVIYTDICITITVSDCCLTQTQQFFSYIMARTS